MGQKHLGKDLDIGLGINLIADLAAGANTGKRIHLKNYSGVVFVFIANAVSAGTDTFVPTVKQHTAASSGTTAVLPSITEWYIKSATTLAGTEAWTRVTQTAAETVSLTGATYAASQVIVAFEITADQLSDGYEWVSLDLPDAGSGGTRLGGAFYIMTGLQTQRRPDALAQPNA